MAFGHDNKLKKQLASGKEEELNIDELNTVLNKFLAVNITGSLEVPP